MIDLTAMEKITNALDEFANGETMHFEIDVAEGVYFDFDCPFSGDLLEPLIPVAVGIQPWSVHNVGEPEYYQLEDYGEIGHELVHYLDEAFYNAGSRNEEIIFEYSENNSNPEKGHYLFLGSIHNPRVSMTKNGPVVNEDYA